MASKFKERVKIGTDISGQPIYAWAVGNTKEELHKSIASILGNPSQGGQAMPKAQQPLWEDYAQMWFDTFHVPNLRPKTVVKDRSLFKTHVKPAFTGMWIGVISTKDIQNYLSTKAHYSKSVLRDAMWMMKAVFQSAFEDGIIARNPMDSKRIANPSTKAATERKALTPEEQDDIIAHLADLPVGNERRLMAFLMFTGMRPCEIYGLKWSDIDFEKRTIRIERDLVFPNGIASIGETKTPKSRRIIPLPDQIVSFLKPIRAEGFVLGKNGEFISSDSVARSIWRRIKATIDVHGMTPYVGRHTYATNMSRAGVPIASAMSLMGHSSERMLLQTYTHVSGSDISEAGKTISEYFETM